MNYLKKKNYLIGIVIFILGLIIGFGVGYSKINTNSKHIEAENMEETLEWSKETLETNKLFLSQETEPIETQTQTTEQESQTEEKNEIQTEKEIQIESEIKHEEETKQEEPALKEEFKVIAYYPSWKPKELSKIQYDIITHIIYAFAIPNSDGSLQPLENPEIAKNIIETAHQNNRKVMLAVGGWSYNGILLEDVFKQATETEEKRKKLVDSIMELCEEYQFDGIDLDWEYPRVNSTSEQYKEFILLLKERLQEKGKLLTAAVLGGVSEEGVVYHNTAAYSDEVLNAIDWIHVMAYDGGNGEQHSSYELAINCATYWKETRNLPGEKVVLGVPFYGRPFGTPYQDILAVDSEADKKDSTVINGSQIWYNGRDMIQKKTRYAIENLGGIMIWEVAQDTTDKEKSLLTAIGEEIKK